ncbi:MAG: T9SS type A sorting domain-containing protein [Bacteroidia bacterium]
MHISNPTGRAMALPKRIFAFATTSLFIGFLLFGNTLSAQNVNAYLSPVPENDGDETEIFIEIGTESQPASNVHSFSATFTTEGFTISAASNFNFIGTPGWLLGSSFDYSYSINSAGTQITIDAWRTDQTGQSGYGYVGKGGAVTCDFDEMVGKNAAEPGLQLVDFKINTIGALALLASPNPSTDFLFVEHPDQQNIGQLKLINMTGAVVRQWEVNQTSIRLESIDIPSGMYMLISSERGVLRKQKILIQH